MTEVKYKEQKIQQVAIFHVNLYYKCAGESMDHPGLAGQRFSYIPLLYLSMNIKN